ncbi:head GIN domain-containing protein [Sphingomonas nostoxanthinifaciens]|uniref:head GIN domain-containing protein n=1 Tax=Sphingomonas nostoxanthinifaciens TaxID=2872652 RepID=UPI001CC204DA|nr:head GIN domain-containing protein [Sphingomonas nostoxanthinifaciens]UAK24665.1 DUF2807 domain-containing protein [Sphingomonas nostoxanthinifaciens]
MRPIVAHALALGLLVAAAAPSSAAVRSFPVGGFDQVRSTGSFDVRIHTGAAPSVHATGEQEVLDRLTVEIRDGALVIGMRPDRNWHWNWGSHRPTIVEVSAPMVRGVALTGSGDLSVDVVRTRGFDASLSGSGDVKIGALQAEAVSMSLSGSGDISAAGRVGRSTLALRGSGNFRTGTLMAQDATISLSGTGNIDAAASRAATVNLFGVGDVRVTGGAQCTITKRGVGDVRCR